MASTEPANGDKAGCGVGCALALASGLTLLLACYGAVALALELWA